MLIVAPSRAAPGYNTLRERNAACRRPGMSDIGHRGVNKDRFRAKGDKSIRTNYPNSLVPVRGTVLAFKVPDSIL